MRFILPFTLFCCTICMTCISPNRPKIYWTKDIDRKSLFDYSDQFKIESNLTQMYYNYGDTIEINVRYINISLDTLNIFPKTVTALQFLEKVKYLSPPESIILYGKFDLKEQIKLSPNESYSINYIVTNYYEYFKPGVSYEMQLVVYMNLAYKINDVIFVTGIFKSNPFIISFISE